MPIEELADFLMREVKVRRKAEAASDCAAPSKCWRS
jgi:hypothetical protein